MISKAPLPLYRAATIGAGLVIATVAIVLSLRAQTTKPAAGTAAVPPGNVAACEALRKHGDSGARACYEALSRSTNLATRAEGLWGLKDYKGAFEVFNSAMDANPKDMNLKVRYGLMMFEAPRGK